MSVGFYLVAATKEISSISIIVRHNGVRYKRAIGVSVKTSKWNSNSQRAKVTQDYPEAAVVNTEIQRYKLAVDNLLNDAAIPDIKDAKHFWALVDCSLNGLNYDSVSPAGKLFVDYFRQVYIQRFLTSKSESRIKRLRVSATVLETYENVRGRRLAFNDINVGFYRDFEAYFKECEYSSNYFGSIIRIVKQVMREAVDIDKIKSCNEFCSSNFKAISADVDTIYLSDEELRRIHALVIDDNFVNTFYPKSTGAGLESYKRSYLLTKNLFLIGAYTGLRLSDFTRLTAEHIANDKISIVTAKTEQKVVIPIHPIIKEILADFDFSKCISEQKIRSYIKDICQAAGITQLVEVRLPSMGEAVVEMTPKYKLVSTHTARRSFATNSFKAGVPTLSIMKITGHKKESTFMKYIRITQEENADLMAAHPFFQ